MFQNLNKSTINHAVSLAETRRKTDAFSFRRRGARVRGALRWQAINLSFDLLGA